MARTLPQIYTSIIAFKQNLAGISALAPTYVIAPGSIQPYQDLIDNMNSASVVSRWRLFVWIVAAAIYILENLWDAAAALLQSIASANNFGTLPWYSDKAKAFQAGFSLLVNSNPVYTYGYTDTTSPAAVAARIITQATAVVVRSINFNGINIKVAQTVGGVLAPLTGPQLVEFTSYIDTIKPPGDRTNIVSINPDSVKTVETIYYDGTLDLPTLQAAVLAAKVNLLTNRIAFNGLLYMNGVNIRGKFQPGYVDTVLGVPGVSGIEVDGLQAKAFTDSFWTTILFNYSPASGYYVYNDADSGITWIPV